MAGSYGRQTLDADVNRPHHSEQSDYKTELKTVELPWPFAKELEN